MACPSSGAPSVHAGAQDARRLLEVDDLHVEFRTGEGTVNAVNGLGYVLGVGETLAILGESGSGKSVSAQAIMGILDSPPGFVTRGAARYRGMDLLRLPPRELRRIRGRRIAMIFQDALTALNPVLTVGFQIGEMFRKHESVSRAAARTRAAELMDRVRIPRAAERLDDYPHQFSGGMRQRVVIAMAVALGPDVLIADEPTTALDVTIQAQIMTLLADLQRETGMGLILITHDLGVVAEVCDTVCVMYAGRIVERGPIHQLYAAPAHPYTLGLMHSIPRPGRAGGRLDPIAGQPPDLMAIPDGCEFHPRCPYARPVCRRERPPLYDVDTAGSAAGAAGEPTTGATTGPTAVGGRQSACHFYEEVLGGR